MESNKNTNMYKLLLLCAICLMSSCHEHSNDYHSNDNSMNIAKQNDSTRYCYSSITLICDYGDANSQILHYTQNHLYHGVGKITDGKDGMLKEIDWNKDYPLKKYTLTNDQRNLLNNLLLNMRAVNDPSTNIAKDDIELLLYIDNKKVFSGYSFYFNSFPKEIQDILKELFSIAPPLYNMHGKA